MEVSKRRRENGIVAVALGIALATAGLFATLELAAIVALVGAIGFILAGVGLYFANRSTQ